MKIGKHYKSGQSSPLTSRLFNNRYHIVPLSQHQHVPNDWSRTVSYLSLYPGTPYAPNEHCLNECLKNQRLYTWVSFVGSLRCKAWAYLDC